ncbi:unnamed protein product [Withania somnifera]
MQDFAANSGNSKTEELSNNPEIKEADQIIYEEVKETDNLDSTKCGKQIERGSEVVINIDENEGTEQMCRICHLNDESMEILELGCDCKGELGVSHRHCAQAWFNQRGNRSCEICGKTAVNVEIRISAEGQNKTMVIEWNQRAVEARRRSYITNSPATHNDCTWCQQSCCNFLLACFVIAFTLPWFFRLNFP